MMIPRLFRRKVVDFAMLFCCLGYIFEIEAQQIGPSSFHFARSKFYPFLFPGWCLWTGYSNFSVSSRNMFFGYHIEFQLQLIEEAMTRWFAKHSTCNTV